MFKYMVFAWDRNDVFQGCIVEKILEQLRADPAVWHVALDRPGLRVIHTEKARSSAGICSLQGNRGVILGSLFKRADGHGTVEERVSAIVSIQRSAVIAESKGRELVNSYWGDYVAVLPDPEADGAVILRAPLGRLPCQYAVHKGVRIFFSWTEDYLRLQLGRLSVNWEYFAARMIDTVQSRMTGLHEISELQPGECIAISAAKGASTVKLWDPYEVASDDIFGGEHQAAVALRHAVRTSVHSWASCYESIVLTLSGGLDSSIVLGCLADAPVRPRITCLTEFSPGYNSDERKFARIAVDYTKCCDHVEQGRNLDVRLEGMLNSARCAVHRGILRRMEVSRFQARVAEDCQAGAFFSGSGGDEVFDPFNPRLSTVDYLFHHGWDAGVWRHLYECAHAEAASVWRTGREVLREKYFGRLPDPLQLAIAGMPLIDASTLTELYRRFLDSQPPEPSRDGLPPGKLMHIEGLRELDEYYDPVGSPGDAEPIVPLMSQPVIETALRIPTYLLSVGGLDRGLARRAFRCELPAEIANRRDKGGVNEHTLTILRRNLPFIRSLMLDGLLVQHKLLDRVKLEEALSDTPSRTTRGLFGIHQYISMEAWLRSWVDHAQRIAA